MISETLEIVGLGRLWGKSRFLSAAVRWILAILLAGALAVQAQDTGIDPTNRFTWSENAGWVNAGPSNNTVIVQFDGNSGWLSGYAWGENLGWIKMGSDAGGPYTNTTGNNWGVNLLGNGNLAGYAWGENIGWLNFDHANCDAAIDLTNGTFSGHVWGENIGWLKLWGTGPDYGARSLAWDTQPLGTPNWWLDYHGVSESYDAGDGIAAWQKYVMDTDPHVEGDYLSIVAITNSPAGTDIVFSPSSTRRVYTLIHRAELTTGNWMKTDENSQVPGTGSRQIMQDTNQTLRMYYRVMVDVP